MSEFVYLIRNKDLYMIGTTENMDTAITQLRPSELVATLETRKCDEVKKRLHNRYNVQRLPQSEYFRLSKTQVEECKKLLVEAGKVESFGPLSGFNVILFISLWASLSGGICWFLIRVLFGGEIF